MIIKKQYKILTILFLSLLTFISTQIQQDDFHISDEQYNQEDYHNNQDFQNNRQQDQNSKRQMEYFSQRRTACLVLSRYYLNTKNDDVKGIINDLQAQDQQKFINKLYTTAVQKCQPFIETTQVIQFFTENKNFDPSSMFYILDGFNFNQLTLDYEQMTPNQQNILKFIKNFDSEMQIRKQEQQAQKMQSQRQQGVQLFFFPINNLPVSMKYIYIVLVILIAGGLLWWAMSQIGQKPAKKSNKRRKT